MRKPIIVGNWKMNKTIAETKAFVEAVDAKVSDSADWGIATLPSKMFALNAQDVL